MAENYIDKIEVDGVERPIRDTSSSVRYDAPQNLTDAQKAQARGNITAAPGGFGLGVAGGQSLSATDDLDTVTKNGVYQWSSSLPKNAPTGYCKMRVWNGADWISQEIMSAYANEKDSIRRRVFNNNVWGPFEWVNPPMQLGVEYRTTERHLGQPVYCKVLEFSTITDGEQIDLVVSQILRANVYEVSGSYYIPVPQVPFLTKSTALPHNSGIAYFMNSHSIVFVRGANNNSKAVVIIYYTK